MGPRVENQPLYGPWVVFVSVCFIFVTVLSLIPASGTLFPYFLEEFGETRAKTATVLAVFKGVGLCSGMYIRPAMFIIFKISHIFSLLSKFLTD